MSGFFSRWIDQRLQKALETAVLPSANGLLTLLPNTTRDYEKHVGKGFRSSVVMAVIFWICRRFAEAKYEIKKGDETLDDHAVLQILRKPNPYFSGRLLRMFIALCYNMDGNVYLWKIRNGQNKPIELWPLPYWMVEPHWPETGRGFIDYYSYYPGWEPVRILPEDMVHIRNGIDPENLRKGMSPLKSLFREIFTDDEAANFSASLLKNMGVPGIIISPGTESANVDPKDLKAVEERLNTRYGRDNRGMAMALKAKTDIKQFGFSPVAMDLSRLREIPEERVTAIFGVAAAVVGFGTGLQQTKVGATMKEMREAAYEDCIIPMQNLYAEELDVQLLPDFESNPTAYNIGFDLSEVRVLQEDEDKRAARNREDYKAGIITQKEARLDRGYEADDRHDVYAIPTNIILTPAGEYAAETEPTIPLRFFLPMQLKGRRDRARLIKAMLIDLEKLSRVYARELRKAFDKLGDEAADLWENLVDKNSIDELKKLSVTRKAAGDEFIEYYAEIISTGVDTNIVNFQPHYIKVAKKTFGTIDTIMGLGVNLRDTDELSIIAEAGKRMGLIDIQGDTKDAVFAALFESREAGEHPYAAAEKIRDYVGAGRFKNAGSQYRARLIARTETKYAQNVSSLRAYNNGGIEQVEIFDAQLGDTDADCEARNGRIVPIHEALVMDEHPNGTLSFAPVVGEFPG